MAPIAMGFDKEHQVSKSLAASNFMLAWYHFRLFTFNTLGAILELSLDLLSLQIYLTFDWSCVPTNIHDYFISREVCSSSYFEEAMPSHGRCRNGVCPNFFAIDKQSIMEHTLLAKLWCCNLHCAKLEIAVWQVSVQNRQLPHAPIAE
jgi:hypothetical protein